MLAEWFDHLAGAVCTSATLTVAKSFRYTSSGIGLSKSAHQTAEVLIPSPFNYKNQALVGVTRDLPLPTESRYPRQLAAAVTKLIRASQGRAFVLFTSYALLERVARDVKPVCDEEGWPLLVQGEAPRTRLLETFRNGNAVLFGTDSFWEGVDVPGTALSAVILTRLPFRVPDDPITEARTEALKRAGHDPFFSYSLPEAVLKFKQGFGRLIRSRQDRGVVVVCDKRILNRRYGRYFFASLPECEGVAGSLTVVDEAVRQWLQ